MSALPKELKGRKASEVFLEYAGPYLTSYVEENGLDNLRKIEYMLQVPWMVWNSVVLKDDPRNKIDYLGSIQLLLKDKPIEMKQLIDSMQERKKTLFSQYNYLLGNFKLIFNKKNNEVKLSMETKK